jgi:uncharacterized coiled-coil protein SlyX
VSTSAKDIQFRELKDTISQLNITIASQNQLIVSLQESVNAANAQEAEHLRSTAALREQIDYLTKKLFGSSSEKRNDSFVDQLNLFDEAEQCSADESAQSVTAQETTPISRSVANSLRPILKIGAAVFLTISVRMQLCQ